MGIELEQSNNSPSSIQKRRIIMDYVDLGFKCGIEIHQRLNTRKLFCECFFDPGKGETPLGAMRKITRRLRPVVGELGKVDPAAAFEALRKRKFTYLIDEDAVCAIEADEEPPHQLNVEALKTALVFSRMLSSRILDDVFVMRKTVIDGSAVSGFQRTALVAVNGTLSTSKGIIRIPTIAIEEESSGILEKKGDETVYRLDRQGIPLLEVATGPTLKDGAHAMEAAELIGQMLRSTGKVQRGLGSIRQDLNVSISQGARVEIKGVQELRLIPELIENEVQRQIGLLKIRSELQSRHMLLGEEHFGLHDLTRLFGNTSCKLIQGALARKESVFAIKLPSFLGLFKTQLMPSHSLGAEIAGYVGAASPAKGITHSDEGLKEKYGFGEGEIAAIRKSLHMQETDLFILCIGSEDTCKAALQAAFERCMLLQKGVPEETRRAEGAISIFMRPLPGSARMYPETDLGPITISKEMVEDAEKSRPEPTEAKKEKYLKWGLNLQLAEKMVRSPNWDLFEKLVVASKAPPQLIAVTLLESLVSIKREGFATTELSEKTLALVFTFYSDSKITKAAIPELMKLLCKYPTKSIPEFVAQNGLSKLSSKELIALISNLEGTKEKKFAEIMRAHRLRVEAQELQKLLEGN